MHFTSIKPPHLIQTLLNKSVKLERWLIGHIS